MIQGTGSGVGKSVITSALCRILVQDGFRVAPFKAQNMALNSFVTEDGGEIGRAQATQAFACKIKPTVDMNPILIKPHSETNAQIILQGKPVGDMSVYTYKNYKKLVFNKVKESFLRLSKAYEIVVIEGAGSPAEINLRSHDLVNMKIAKLASSPVILVGDIDRGGVFAWLIGTLKLLTQDEKRRVAGFVINKFRGDKRLLLPGLRFLEKYTGKKVLGVIPFYRNISIPEEDSLPLEPIIHPNKRDTKERIEIAVVKLPYMSNFTDFDSLDKEPDVRLSYITDKYHLNNADIIIIPGTKNTINDMSYLKRTGFSKKILSVFNSKPLVQLIGICGGYQMLGKKIYGPESRKAKSKAIDGLGILTHITQMFPEKILSQVKAKNISSGIAVWGYEIHHGKSESSTELRPVFELTCHKNSGIKRFDGNQTPNRRCWGTYIHGIFDSDKFRRNLLDNIRKSKGWQPLKTGASYQFDTEMDNFSNIVRKNINLDLFYKILLKGGEVYG